MAATGPGRLFFVFPDFAAGALLLPPPEKNKLGLIQ
jgi:hypothetical protein